MITIDPDSDLPQGAVYVAISSALLRRARQPGRCNKRHLHGGQHGPGADLQPGQRHDDQGQHRQHHAGNSTRRIKANATNTDFTDSTIDGILTLKTTDSSGSNIGFDATIDNAKKVITINPSMNLADGAVYVAISNAYYDGNGNQGSMETATFTVDTTGPTPTFSPDGGTTTKDNATDITLEFGEAIKKTDMGTDLVNADLASILTLKEDNSGGTNIPYSATINDAKTTITINPNSNLADGNVYVAISNAYYDGDGNQGRQASATFTVDTAGPVPTFDPADGETATDNNTANITLEFNEAIRKDGSGINFTDSDIDDILTLKAGGSGGTPIDFDATIDGAKTVITINPSANLADAARCTWRSPAPTNDGVGNQGSNEGRDVHGGQHGPDADLQPGQRRDGDRQHRQHHADLRRGDQGERRHRLHRHHHRQHPDAGGRRQRRHTHPLRRDHRRRQEDHHDQPDLEPRRWRGLRGGQQTATTTRTATRAMRRTPPFTVDTTGPVPTFDPANGATTKDNATNITLEFNEAIQGGQRRHRLHRHHHRQHPDAEGDQRQRHGHRLRRNHRRRQKGRHDQPVGEPRRRRRVRGDQQRLLRRARQPGRYGRRHFHGGHHGRGGADVSARPTARRPTTTPPTSRWSSPRRSRRTTPTPTSPTPASTAS